MLILAKFLARKIIKSFDFSKAKVLYFNCLMDKKRVGQSERRVTLKKFDITEIELTSSLPNFLNAFFQFFVSLEI